VGRQRMAGLPLVAVLAFFTFPLLTFSCGGIEVANVTGYDLVVGGEISTADSSFGSSGDSESQSVEVEPLAVIAVLAAAFGALAAFAGSSSRLLAGVSSTGAVALVALMISLQGDISQARAESGGLISASFATGFWLALLGFAGSSILAWRDARTGNGVPPKPP